MYLYWIGSFFDAGYTDRYMDWSICKLGRKRADNFYPEKSFNILWRWVIV